MKALDEAIIGLAARQHGAFTREQALAAGATRSSCDRRLRSGLWCPTGYSGVYVLAGHPASWHQRLLVAVLAGPRGTVASHRAAAVLLGLHVGTPVEITVPRGGQARLPGLIVHQGTVAPRDRGVVGGTPATKVERTLLDLAGVLGENGVEQAAEAAFRLGLTSAERLRRYLDTVSGRGRRGVVNLGRLLARRTDGRPTGSPLEVAFLQLLRAAGVAEPVRQYEVRVGGERFFLDWAYPHRRLAIELDGFEHHGGRSAFQRDRARQNALVLNGWTVLRFTGADVATRAHQTVAAVTRALVA